MIINHNDLRLMSDSDLNHSFLLSLEIGRMILSFTWRIQMRSGKFTYPLFWDTSRSANAQNDSEHATPGDGDLRYFYPSSSSISNIHPSVSLSRTLRIKVPIIVPAIIVIYPGICSSQININYIGYALESICLVSTVWSAELIPSPPSTVFYDCQH